MVYRRSFAEDKGLLQRSLMTAETNIQRLERSKSHRLTIGLGFIVGGVPLIVLASGITLAVVAGSGLFIVGVGSLAWARYYDEPLICALEDRRDVYKGELLALGATNELLALGAGSVGGTT